MKEFAKFYRPCITIFIGTILFTTGLFAQIEWTHVTDQPVLDYGAPGEWDEHWVFNPSVMKDGDTLRMWYSGYNPDGVGQIGYASSINGIEWNKYARNPVLSPDLPWEDTEVLNCTVMKDGDTLRMWYYAGEIPTTVIGYAKSVDGIYWEKHPEPVLQSREGDWEEDQMGPTTVIKEGDIYKMWYWGLSFGAFPPDGSYNIGFATSTDAIHWNKYDDPLTMDPPYSDSDPVLMFGSVNDWDELDVFHPMVISTDWGYQMWYVGSKSYNTGAWIGYATSSDGIVWNKWPLNPIIDTSPSWGGFAYEGGCVLGYEDIFHIWYSSYNSEGGRPRIGYATSTPFLHDIMTVITPQHLSSLPILANNVIPEVQVANIGLSNEDNVTVTCIIDSCGTIIYSNTQTIATLENNTLDIKTVTFDKLGVTSDGIYNVFYTTQLFNDLNMSNDTLETIVKISNLMDDFETGFGKWFSNTGWGIMEDFSTTTPNFILNDSPQGDGYYGNDVDSWVEYNYSFDLSHLDAAHIAYKTQYLIEPEHDFGYVEVSTDSGQSWHQLGEGITGYMGWIEDTRSLTDYCGSGFDDVRIRFHFVSDDTQEWPLTGWFLDDIFIYPFESPTAVPSRENNQFPREYALHDNYPNPFNPTTTIGYEIPETSQVTLEIYNVLGRLIRTLVDERHQSGHYQHTWDAHDADGNLVPTGVYFYKINAGSFVSVKKMILMK